MGKSSLYIMCGLPFSGKTVLVKRLVERLNLTQVSIDEIKFADGFQWVDNTTITTEDWKSIFRESNDKTLALLQKGKSVIYDSANQDRIGRDRLRAVAAKGDFPTKVILQDVPL